MNQEILPMSLNSRLLDVENNPEKGPGLSLNFRGYRLENHDKFEWVFHRLIEMGFQKEDILQIMNSNEIHKHQDKEEDLICNFVLMMLLETPPGMSNIDPDSEGNVSLVITSQIREKKEEKYRETQDVKKQNGAAIKNIENKAICGICCSSDIKFEIIPKCKHQFCDDCFMKYLIYSIENDSQKLLDLPCPESTCQNKLPLSFIEKKLKSNEIYLKKFQKFIKIAKFSKNPSYRPCIKPNCENYVKKPFLGNKTKCLCGQIMCFKCRKPWHEGQNFCYEYVEYNPLQNEEDFLSYQKSKNLKNCPNCQMFIEKNLGCNHITCVKCGYQFCWVCFSKWEAQGCPKKCALAPQDHYAELAEPEDYNMRSWDNVSRFLNARVPDEGRIPFIFLWFYYYNFDLGCWFYLLLFPYILSHILGFLITLTLMILSMPIYVYTFLIWVVYFETMAEHYDQIGSLYDAGFLKACSFIILWVLRVFLTILDSVYSLVAMILFFIIIYVKNCCRHRNCWFFLRKLHFNLFRKFFFLMRPDHQLYTGRNHAFERPNFGNLKIPVYSMRLAVTCILCINILPAVLL